MKLKKFFICLFSFFISAVAVSQSLSDFAVLLEGYASNDTTRQSLELDKRSAFLSMQRYNIEAGTAFTISTGQTVIEFPDSGAQISARPGITVGLPQLRNTSISAEVPLEYNGNDPPRAGVNVTARTDIFSGNAKSRQTGLEEKERQYIVAARQLESHKLQLQKEFWEDVREIYGYRNDIYKAQEAIVLARQDMETREAAGYTASSTVWRTTELKLRSRQRELTEAERTYARSLEEFARSCGIPVVVLPEVIPGQELADISAFPQAGFSELESAEWNHYINTMSRSASGRSFSLNGLAGYSLDRITQTSSVSGGVGISLPGVTLSSALSFPLDSSQNPALSISLEWKPNGIRTHRIDNEIREISGKKELLNIHIAKKNYYDTVLEYDRKKEDLEWQQEVYTEEFEVYKTHAGEQEQWYRAGIISETDYLQSQTEYKLAEYRLQALYIDCILYNLDVALLFIPELSPEDLL
ncbi:hypothetical protein K7I13_06820 [Brucepastera parasyntrophica]|uniref:hypothetical protein n=1 Tax=Brucepastera parasyntrophica TaxID=2880008 RepID=UPI00210B3C52|nr:hypothetical protein [Brucepastera parasyntrophica]ULQ60960.1 hypothetical protein K7I13_06820 [Brucepastera parasyntrophica]